MCDHKNSSVRRPSFNIQGVGFVCFFKINRFGQTMHEINSFSSFLYITPLTAEVFVTHFQLFKSAMTYRPTYFT